MAYATAADVAARAGQTFDATQTSQVEAFLSDATAFIDNYCRQSFEQATSSQILRLFDNRVRLPRRPVSDVDTVKYVNLDGTVGAALTGWSFDGIDTVDMVEDRQQLNLPEWWRDEHDRTVEVTYTHGFGTVPDDIKAVCARLAHRAYSNPQGLQSETIGQYSYSIATPQGGINFGVHMDRSDRDVLDRYRRTAWSVEIA